MRKEEIYYLLKWDVLNMHILEIYYLFKLDILGIEYRRAFMPFHKYFLSDLYSLNILAIYF